MGKPFDVIRVSRFNNIPENFFFLSAWELSPCVGGVHMFKAHNVCSGSNYILFNLSFYPHNSNQWVYSITCHFAFVFIRKQLLTDWNQSLDSLHPFSGHLIVQNIRNPLNIFPDFDQHHRLTHGPWGISNRQIDIPIIGLDILSNKTAVPTLNLE